MKEDKQDRIAIEHGTMGSHIDPSPLTVMLRFKNGGKERLAARFYWPATKYAIISVK